MKTFRGAATARDPGSPWEAGEGLVWRREPTQTKEGRGTGTEGTQGAGIWTRVMVGLSTGQRRWI